MQLVHSHPLSFPDGGGGGGEGKGGCTQTTPFVILKTKTYFRLSLFSASVPKVTTSPWRATTGNTSAFTGTRLGKAQLVFFVSVMNSLPRLHVHPNLVPCCYWHKSQNNDLKFNLLKIKESSLSVIKPSVSWADLAVVRGNPTSVLKFCITFKEIQVKLNGIYIADKCLFFPIPTFPNCLDPPPCLESLD